MRLSFIIFSFALIKTVSAQTNSHQLSSLVRRIDSLTLLIQTERASNHERILDLKKQISEKENQLVYLERQLGFNKNESNPTPHESIKTYKSITIGKQTWMKENLNVSSFRNGDPIPEAKTKEEWIIAGIEGKPAWCYYDNDPKNDEKYGKLYNWYAVNDPRGLAPIGWRIPAFDDSNILDTYLWGDVGMKLKNESGWDSWSVEERCKACTGWTDNQRKLKKCSSCNNKGFRISATKSGNGSNSSGFAALPGGYRNANGEFEKMGQQCNLWSSTQQFTAYGRFRILLNMDDELIMNYTTKEFGMSVRCLKE